MSTNSEHMKGIGSGIQHAPRLRSGGVGYATPREVQLIQPRPRVRANRNLRRRGVGGWSSSTVDTYYDVEIVGLMPPYFSFEMAYRGEKGYDPSDEDTYDERKDCNQQDYNHAREVILDRRFFTRVVVETLPCSINLGFVDETGRVRWMLEGRDGDKRIDTEYDKARFFRPAK